MTPTRPGSRARRRGPGDAVIGRDLARTLHIGTGATIEAFAYGTTVKLRVVRVLPKLGIAGFWRGDETRANNAFVAPGTIATMSAGRPGAPPQSLVLVSNRGGVEQGARLTDRVDAAVRAQLGPGRYSVEMVKRTVLDRADRGREVALAALHVARHVRRARRHPAPRQHLLHARRRAEVRARHAARGRAAAGLARRRVRRPRAGATRSSPRSRARSWAWASAAR